MGNEKGVSEKTRINVSDRIKNENKYYLKVSEKYRLSGFLFLVLFVVFAGIMLVKFGNNITYDNIVYLARDFNSAMGTSGESISELNFAARDNVVFSPFRDGIAVAGSTGLSIYGPTGQEEYGYTSTVPSPELRAGDKYLLLFSPGSDSYSVFGSSSRIFERKVAGSVVSADMSDTGAFVIANRISAGKYDVEIFGDDLKRVMTVHKDKHVIDTSISPDGRFVAILSAVEGNIDLSGEIYVVKSGSTDPVLKETVGSSVPLLAHFTGSGTLTVVFDDRIDFYDSEMNRVSSTDLSASPPAFFDAGKEGVIIALRENAIGTKNRIMAFDTDGELIYNELISENVISVASSRDPENVAGFVRTGDKIIELPLSGEPVSENCKGDVVRMIGTKNGLLVCTNGRIYRIFSDQPPKEGEGE